MSELKSDDKILEPRQTLSIKNNTIRLLKEKARRDGASTERMLAGKNAEIKRLGLLAYKDRNAQVTWRMRSKDLADKVCALNIEIAEKNAEIKRLELLAYMDPNAQVLWRMRSEDLAGMVCALNIEITSLVRELDRAENSLEKQKDINNQLKKELERGRDPEPAVDPGARFPDRSFLRRQLAKRDAEARLRAKRWWKPWTWLRTS